MIDKSDPFGLANDAGRTRIRPQSSPQPKPPSNLEASPSGPPPAAAPLRLQRNRTVANPLVASFSALLELAPELESADPPQAVEDLRVQLHSQLVESRDEAVRRGASIEQADAALWNVAALFDDIVLNTPWGGNSSWPVQTLVATQFGDVNSGSQFFERLEELRRYPDRDPQLLELTYYCLALGFKGKYRVPGREGASSLTEVHQTTAWALANPDDATAPLSPNWKGVVAENRPQGFVFPIWAMAIAAIAFLTATYMVLSINLSNEAGQLYEQVRRLPPAERSNIYRPAPAVETAVVATSSPVEPVSFDLLPFYLDNVPVGFESVLSGEENTSTALLRLQGSDPELFRSAKADVNGSYVPLIDFIAEVSRLNSEIIGQVVVFGHTDSIPVQRSNPFSSNQKLSDARARTIAQMLADAGVPIEKIAYQGRADSEPIADNTTREGRARNRRVEILFQKSL